MAIKSLRLDMDDSGEMEFQKNNYQEEGSVP